MSTLENNLGKMSNAQGMSSTHGRDKSQKDDEYIYDSKVPSDDESSTFTPSGSQTFTKTHHKKRAPREVPRELVFFNAAEKRLMRETYKTNPNPSKKDIDTMIKVDFAGKNYTVKKVEKFFWGMRRKDGKTPVKPMVQVPKQEVTSEPSSAADWSSEQLRLLHRELSIYPRSHMRVPYKDIAAKVGLSEMNVMIWFSWHRDITRAKAQFTPTPKTRDADIFEPRPDDGVKKMGMTLYEAVAAIEGSSDEDDSGEEDLDNKEV